MRQTTKHVFKRIEQDISKDKRSSDLYWEAVNLKLINNGSNMSLTSHDGTRDVLSFGTGTYSAPGEFTYNYTVAGVNMTGAVTNASLGSLALGYTEANITGVIEVFDDIYLFVVYDHPTDTTTVIFKLSFSGLTYSLTGVYVAPLKMSYDRYVTALFNYENENVAKLYWIDGINQLRYFNINDPASINLAPGSVDMRPDAEMHPINNVSLNRSYGTYLKSTVQYAYILYNQNGQASGMSPLTRPFVVSGTNSEITTDTTNASIEFELDITTTIYNSVKIFRIQYVEGTAMSGALTPKVFVINDMAVSPHFNIIDTQDINDPEITLAELLTYGSMDVRPRYMIADKNRLLIANYAQEQLNIDFDARAYSYPKDSITTVIYDNPNDASTAVTINSTDLGANVPKELNCVKGAGDKHTHIFKANSSDAGSSFNYGATGPNLDLTLLYYDASGYLAEYISSDAKESFKQREIYRIGIEFYNAAGQASAVNWITDLYIPPYKNQYEYPPVIRLRCEINNTGRDLLAGYDITNYKLYMVERGVVDKSVLTQGFLLQANDKLIIPATAFTPAASIDLEWTAPTECTYEMRPLGGMLDHYVESLADSNPSKYNALYTPDASFGLIDHRGSDVCIVGGVEGLDHRIDIGFENYYSTMINHYMDVAQFTGGTFPASGCSSTSRRLSMSMGSGDALRSNFQSKRTVFGKQLPSESVGNAKYLDDHGYSINPGATAINDVVELDGDPILLNESSSNINMEGEQVSRFMLLESRTGQYVESAPCYMLKFKDSEWHKNALGYTYGKFHYGINSSGLPIQEPTVSSLPIIELVKNLPNQYDGYTYEVKQFNEYAPISEVTNISESAIGFGDVYIQEFNIRRSSFPGTGFAAGYNFREEWTSVVLESNVNLNAREDKTYDYGFSEYNITTGSGCPDPTGGYLFGNGTDMGYEGLFNLRGLFQTHPGIPSFAKPYNYKMVENYKLSILITSKKHNNEQFDSWLNFLTDEALSLEATYGEITGLAKFMGKTVAFQERAISLIHVAPTAQQAINTSGGAMDIILGEGSPLHSFTFISTRAGTLHNRSIVSSKQGLYFFDYHNKSISMVANTEQNELSTALGLRTYFLEFLDTADITKDYNDLELGVVAHFNNPNELIYFTFNGNENTTVTYSPINKGFISFHTFRTHGYAKDIAHQLLHKGNRLYMFDDSIVTVFNGDTETTETVDQTLTILDSGNDQYVRRYDNIEFAPIIKNDYFAPSFTTWESWNSYQTTGHIGFLPSMRMRKNRSIIPRAEASMNRMRDDHMYTRLVYSEPNKIQVDSLYVMMDIPRINNYTQNIAK